MNMTNHQIQSRSHNEISKRILDAAMEIHRKPRPGLFESVYLEILCLELDKMGLLIQRNVPVPVDWKGVHISVGFRADIIVEDKVIVELKSVEKTTAAADLSPAADKRLGLPVNFGAPLLKDGIIRIVNKLDE